MSIDKKATVRNIVRLIMKSPLYLAIPIWCIGLASLPWTPKEDGIMPVYLFTVISLFWILTWFIIKSSERGSSK